jgi:hypothetical protein
MLARRPPSGAAWGRTDDARANAIGERGELSCGLSLDLPSIGGQSGALGFEVGQGRDLPLALASEHLAGLALAINRRECSISAQRRGRDCSPDGR